MKKITRVKKYLFYGLGLLGAVSVGCSAAQATALSVFDGWTQFADDDGMVAPGVGGQAFDAEYLFYKLDGGTLSIGLQAGFDLIDGHQRYTDGRDYWAGDLFLSFDNDSTTYEYAFDAGLYTADFGGGAVGPSGLHGAGLYEVTDWDLGVYSGHVSSNPFAMEAGNFVTAGATDAGFVGSLAANGLVLNNNSYTSLDSYWRTYSFNLADLSLTQFAGFDAHWTMSCGNDVIEGTAPVPEPATMLLFGTGLVGLAGLRKRRNKMD